MKSVLAIFFCCFITLAMAQERGSINGIVYDEVSCDRIGFAFVIATDLSHKDTFWVRTDLNGEFIFEALPASEYSVVIKSFGYNDYETKLMVSPGQTAYLDVEMDDFIICCGCESSYSFPVFFEIQGSTYSREEIRRMPY